MNEDSRILRNRMLCSEILALLDKRIKRIVVKPSTVLISQVSYGDNITEGDAGEDVLCAVDAAATAGYLGAAYNDGILRLDASLWADGGDFCTATVTKAKVSSDDTTPNYLENKIVAGANIGVTILNPAGNETAQINYTGSAGGIGSGFFGPGTDGDVVISANTLLTRDMYYDDLTINAGFTLNPGGFRIYCSGTCTVSATAKISGNGNDGTNGGNAVGITGGTAGSGASAVGLLAYMSQGLAGQAGKAGGGGGAPGAGGLGVAGNNGTAVDNVIETANVDGVAGGAGGDSNGTAGGAAGAGGTKGAGVIIDPTFGWPYNLPQLELARVFPPLDHPAKYTYSAGNAGSGSGGGGASEGFAEGGGGGGSGGCGGNSSQVFVAAKTLVNAGAISSDGGDAGDGGNGANADGGPMSNAAGGGGGGAGAIGGNGNTCVIIYESKSGAGTITATKGSGGALGTAGSGVNGGQNGDNGTAGSDGIDGKVIEIQLGA